MFQRLGQHFLKNKTKLKKIVDALELKESDVVIEIGPGHGELTYEIKNKKPKIKIIAIERDKELARALSHRVADKDLEVIEGDALKEIKNQIEKIKNTPHKLLRNYTGQANQKSKIIENLKIVGNIPYYITGYLFRVLGELESKPNIIVFTIQKEVAERITAKPPHMNLLAASIQFWAEPKIIGYISKKDFKPQPKVDSSMLKLEVRGERLEDSHTYYKFIRILFKQPRKTVVNNLVAGNRLQVTSDRGTILKKLHKFNIDPQSRPQNLTLAQIFALAKEFGQISVS